MHLSLKTSINPQPAIKFSGVRIQEVHTPESRDLAFQVFPDTHLQGVQYQGETRPSAAADEVTRLAGDFRKNNTHRGNANLFNLNANEPAKLTALLGQLLQEAPMDDERKAKYTAGLAYAYKRRSEPCWEGNVSGATQFYYPRLSVNPAKPKLVPYPNEFNQCLEYAQQILTSEPFSLEQHSAKGVARAIRRAKGSVDSQMYVVLAAAAFKDGNLSRLQGYLEEFPYMKATIERELNYVSRYDIFPNREAFRPMLQAIGLDADQVLHTSGQ